jgi:putative ABC transport system substrate-binding protein
MKRRDFIALLSGTAAAWPLALRAQQNQRMRLVGVMMAYATSEAEGQRFANIFREELKKLGWADGQNVQIDYRWTSGDAALRVRSAMELIARQPDVILSHNTPTTLALVQQTRTIPIVFALCVDPIGDRLVANMPRPGGNVTGFTALEPTISSKWLELIKEIAPSIRKVLVVFNPATAPYADNLLSPLKAAGPSLNVEVRAAPINAVSELTGIVSNDAERSAIGFVVLPDSFTTAHRSELISFAEQHRIPSIFAYRFFATDGGLLSYGIEVGDNFRRAAIYVDRILRGAMPSDLPVQAPVKYVMAVNLTTARALGLEVPTSILLGADEVIE